MSTGWLAVCSLLLSLSTLTLIECRIYSGQSFPYGTNVELTCHNDVLGFAGNLWIARGSAIIYQISKPADPSATLYFQHDGAEKPLFLFVFVF